MRRVFDAFAEERAVGQHDRGPAAGLEQTNDEGQEQVGRLARLEVLGEVAFDAVFLAAAEGRVGEDDFHAVGLAVADVRPGQRVVVADEARVLNAVKEHVGHAEHVWQWLLFNCPHGGLHRSFISRCLDVTLAHVAN